MPTNQSAQIMSLIDELDEQLQGLSSTEDLQELRTLVQRPGWTTLAEQTFVINQLTALIDQLQAAEKLREALLAGSKQVGGRREPVSPHAGGAPKVPTQS